MVFRDNINKVDNLNNLNDYAPLYSSIFDPLQRNNYDFIN